jgi:hypothetical protein
MQEGGVSLGLPQRQRGAGEDEAAQSPPQTPKPFIALAPVFPSHSSKGTDHVAPSSAALPPSCRRSAPRQGSGASPRGTGSASSRCTRAQGYRPHPQRGGRGARPSASPRPHAPAFPDRGPRGSRTFRAGKRRRIPRDGAGEGSVQPREISPLPVFLGCCPGLACPDTLARSASRALPLVAGRLWFFFPHGQPSPGSLPLGWPCLRAHGISPPVRPFLLPAGRHKKNRLHEAGGEGIGVHGYGVP